MPEPSGEATRLLSRVSEGDERAADDLLALLYAELHEIASRLMDGQREGHTLQPTALVNEAWLKLAVPVREGDWDGHAHFLRFAARAMRSVLIDHARGRNRAKRGGSQAARVPLDAVLHAAEDRVHDLLAFDEALASLERLDPELARVVELRFYGGLAIAEIAHVLGVSVPTAERRWRTARVWLRATLENDHDV